MTWVAMWMFASFHSTSLPFIQILPVPENAMSAPASDLSVFVAKRRRSGFGEAEPGQHLPPAKGRDAERAAVEILHDPALLQRGLQQGRAKGAAEVRPPLAPVDAREREAAP